MIDYERNQIIERRIVSIKLPVLKNYISNELNIIITGPTGTGKTSIVNKAVSDLGLSHKYYHVPTLDPFADFVGLPVPQNDTKTVEFYRPRGIDDAEVIIFDELNRGDDRIQNALFEIILFRTINGEPLPKLKCVVAAINPDDGEYHVDALDPALLERFDVYLSMEPKIDLPYFKEKFGDDVAIVASRWWSSYHDAYTRNHKNSTENNKIVYLSPRRLDKMLTAYMKISSLATLRDTRPIGFTGPINILHEELQNAMNPKPNDGNSVDDVSDDIRRVLDFTIKEMRSTANIKSIQTILDDETIDKNVKDRILSNMAMAFRDQVSPQRLMNNWGSMVMMMSPSQLKIMRENWTTYKRSDLNELMKAYTLMNDN